MSHQELIKLLSKFGNIPEYQVKFIWDMAYDAGLKYRDEQYRARQISEKQNANATHNQNGNATHNMDAKP